MLGETREPVLAGMLGETPGPVLARMLGCWQV
jgi:hypothetical protein